MIHHVSIGVSDVARANGSTMRRWRRLAPSASAKMRARLAMAAATVRAYGCSPPTRRCRATSRACTSVSTPATLRGGRLSCSRGPFGGGDNGKPGLRADYGENYYAAFVTDPDGNRIEAYCSRKE